MSRQMSEFGQAVWTMQRDLHRKYIRDKETIRSTWSELSSDDRKKVILAGVAGGTDGFLLHRNDSRRQIDKIRFMVPELNLRDLTGEKSTLLKLLETRAMNDPHEMFYAEDAEFMVNSVRTHGLRDPVARPNSFMMFHDPETYGQTMVVPRTSPRGTLENMLEMGKGGILIENEGRWVLTRQNLLYSQLTLIVDDIMEKRRDIDDPHAKKRRPKKKLGATGSVEQALKAFDLAEAPEKKAKAVSKAHSWEDVKELVEQQFLSTEDHANLMVEQPLYFAMVSNQYYHTSPECVLDEKGFASPYMMSGLLATRVVLESLRDGYRAANTWKVLAVLVSELSSRKKDTKAAILLTTELWSICTKELQRTRMVFRRMIQMDFKHNKFFVRSGDAVDLTNDGQVKFKDNPDVVSRKNKFASLLLQLATKTEMSDTEAASIMRSISEFQSNVPKAGETISGSMGEALADVSVVVVLMSWLRERKVVIPKQPASVFVKEMGTCIERIDKARDGLDLTDFAYPSDNLKDPAQAKGCLAAIDKHFSESKLGAPLAKIFENATKSTVEAVLSSVPAVELSEKLAQPEVPFDPFLPSPAETDENIRPTAGSSTKTKTRPSAAALDRYFPPTTTATPASASSAAEPVKVEAPKPALQTFKKLFRTDAPEKSGIPWSAFVSAMKGIGFGVEPVGGSVSKFVPPEGSNADWKPINLHRPHPGDRIEGWILVKLAGRLWRRYGWEKETFVVKK